MKKILCAIIGLLFAVPSWGACYDYTSATGTASQIGTPTPDNPIYPTFYKQGDMVLRKVGNIADTYDATTGKITRRVGEYTFTGDENISMQYNVYGITTIPYDMNKVTDASLCSHNKTYINSVVTGNRTFDKFLFFTNVNMVGFGVNDTPSEITDATTFKQWLAAQYAAGTPVKIYYPLETEVVEDWAATTYCPGCDGTVVSGQWNQLVKNGNFADGVNNWISETSVVANAENGVLSVTYQSYGDRGVGQIVEIGSGHKVFVSFDVDSYTGESYIGVFRGSNGASMFRSVGDAVKINRTGHYEQVRTLTALSDGFEYYTVGAGRPVGEGVKVSFSNLNVIDLTEMFGTGNEPSTEQEAKAAIAQRANELGISATNNYYAYHANENVSYCISKIKVATTKYVETQFSDLGTRLAAAVATVNTVVSNTITQAASIATLQSGKQTRPDETCPAGKQCLLVTDTDGQPHWYEIFDPINRWLEGWISAGKPAVKGTQTDGKWTYYNAFYKGDSAWRAKYADGSSETYDRPIDHATRCTSPSYNTETPNASPCYSEVGMFKTLTDGEWAEVYTTGDGTNAPVGVVYGTSKCTSVAGPNNYSTANPTKFSELSAADQAKWAELPAPYGEADREGYERAKFTQCWCKMTAVGVPGEDGDPANGSVYPVNVSSSAWVFSTTRSSAAGCANSCAAGCADGVRINASFRSAVFGM
ncbi:MAG: hypothetical protein ACLRFM_01310 [Alphaproteobacteria bacterium]